MPSLGSLVLRYFSVFAVTVVISFFTLALAIGFLGIRVSGLLPFGIILGLSLVVASISTGKLIGQTTGEVPGEIFTLIVALFCSSSVLTALALFLVQSKSSGWLTGLPSTDDPAAQDILVKAAGIFLAAAAILSRFGLIYGARIGARDYTPPYHPMQVVEVPPEIYHSHHGYTHPQPSAFQAFDGEAPGPGVVAMIGRLFLTSILAGVLFGLLCGGAIAGVQIWGIMHGQIAPNTQLDMKYVPFVQLFSIPILFYACYRTGRYYGKKAHRPMSPEFAWGVSLGYWALSLILTLAMVAAAFAFLPIPMPVLPDIPPAAIAVAMIAFVLISILFAFLMKGMLRVGSKAAAPVAISGYR